MSYHASSQLPVVSEDPIGCLLLNQPDALVDGLLAPIHPRQAARVDAPERIDALLAPGGAEDDDLLFELMYLEALLSGDPSRVDEALGELGELGVEVKSGLVAGTVDLVAVRERVRRLAHRPSSAASRVTAAMLLAATGLPALGGAAHAAGTPDASTFQIAAAPVVRVVDAASGQGVAGVQIKSMEEQLLGVTDATGQATLSEGYMDTDLLSLEKDGYQMYLLDRSQLSSRNIVSMKPAAKVAGRPTAPKVATVPTPRAVSTPVVKLPVRPKNPKVASVATPQPKATPMKALSTPRPVVQATPRPKIQVTPLVLAPTLQNPKQHPVKVAGTRPSPDVMSQPVAPRHAVKPVAHRPFASAHAPASGVAVPRKMPAHRAGRQAAASHYYRVRAGDTLSGIAYRQLGSANAWHEIFAANHTRLANPNVLRVGQQILVPSAAGAHHAHHAHHATRYTVRPGDSLYTIAQRQYGQGDRWHAIFNANRGHLRSPRLIFPGQHLLLP